MPSRALSLIVWATFLGENGLPAAKGLIALLTEGDPTMLLVDGEFSIEGMNDRDLLT